MGFFFCIKLFFHTRGRKLLNISFCRLKYFGKKYKIGPDEDRAAGGVLRQKEFFSYLLLTVSSFSAKPVATVCVRACLCISRGERNWFSSFRPQSLVAHLRRAGFG